MLCTFCGTDNSSGIEFCGMCGVRLERRKIERRVQRGSDGVSCASCGQVNAVGRIVCTACGNRVDGRISKSQVGTQDALPVTAVTEGASRSPEQNAAKANGLSPLPTTVVAEVLPPVPDPPTATTNGHQTAQEKPIATSNGQVPALQTPLVQAPAAKPRLAEPVPAAKVPVSLKPVAAPRRAPAKPVRITGHSFLGLSDDQQTGAYLLQNDKPPGGMLRKLALVALVIAVGGLSLWAWQSGLLARLGLVGERKPSTSHTIQASAASSVAGTDAAASSSGAAPEGQSDISKTPATSEADVPAAEAGTVSAETTTTSKKQKAVPKGAEDARRKPSPTLLMAQRYLQGSGGKAQNCDQGLSYLTQAVKRSEPAAAVQMSNLYASGQCKQRDRVMAYRWLNSARELDPANAQIRASMEQLWTQMNAQERRQARP